MFNLHINIESISCVRATVCPFIFKLLFVRQATTSQKQRKKILLMNEWANPISQFPLAITSQTFFGMRFDTINQAETLDLLATRDADAQFGYVVTPNVQHVVDAHRKIARKQLFEDSLLCICDSQPVRALAYFLGNAPSLVTGADLTVALFENVIQDGDTISTICASEELAKSLQQKYPNLDWHVHIPPADTDVGTPAFDECVEFLTNTPARFSFVCIGAPKSEEICHAAFELRSSTGTAICTGAALEFLVGLKKRAPRIFQTLGIEWVYRIISEPGRLWRRYASAGPTLLKLFFKDLKMKWFPLKHSH